MELKAQPLGGKLFTRPFLVFLAIFLVAAWFVLKRFIYGIGAVTHLSDGYPWGVWIAYDVIIGCALACGGYGMAIIVYIANKGRYHALVRPAVLTSAFGYTLAGVSILFDIGRYWQFYNLLLPTYIQFNSIMVEVALCIMAYVCVLWIELSPAFLERFNIGGKIKMYMEKALFIIVALGILLPTMHQSSLGSLLLIAGSKVSPLWHTPLLPLLFLTSCLVMGYCVVVAESFMSSVAFKRPYETELLSKVGVVVASLTAAYLVLRFADLAVRGAINLSFEGDLKGGSFWIENALFAVPMILLFMPRTNRNPRVLFLSSAMLLLGAGLYRINTYIIGFSPGSNWSYFPSAPELMITLGIISIEIMAYLVLVKKLPIMAGHEPELKAGGLGAARTEGGSFHE